MAASGWSTWNGTIGRSRHPFNGILLQEYDPAARRLVGPVRNIFRGTDLRVTEGPHIYRRNGYYYLLTAEGGTGYTTPSPWPARAISKVRTRWTRSSTSSPPKTHPQLPLQRAGHGDWVETQNGEIYIVHLCGRPLSLHSDSDQQRCPLGRETAIQKARWTEDGWLRLANGSNTPDMTDARARPAAAPVARGARDDALRFAAAAN